MAKKEVLQALLSEIKVLVSELNTRYKSMQTQNDLEEYGVCSGKIIELEKLLFSGKWKLA